MSGKMTIVVGDKGRVVLPAEVRKRHDLAPGTPLIVLDGPTGVVLLTREQLRDRVRSEFAGLDLVTELIEERRAAARRDEV